MTSTLAHGAARGHGERTRPLRALTASPALILLLLGGLALRLTIAYVLFPSSGFESDVTSYASWALTLGEHGPAGFYASTSFSDYPPAYLYLLWPIGAYAAGTADPFATAASLVKVPPILLDLAVGYVIYRLVLGWAWPGRRAERMALLAAALYVFNPLPIYDSALWGQTDAAGALVVLLGVAALVRGNSEGAAALAATAALVKPQFGVVLIPLVGFMLLKRHLVRPGSGPRQRPWAPAPLADWLASHHGATRLVTSLLAAVAAFFVLALPFGMGPLEYLERMVGTAGGYSYLSVNAFNAWALAGSGDTPPLAGSLQWSDDTIGFWGPVPAVVIGGVLLLAAYLWGALRAAARDDRWTVLVAATFLAIAFFILPTRVHERYIFPAVALMPILAVAQARWGVALLLLSAGAFINFHAILTLPVYGTDNVTGLPLGEWFRSAPLIVLSAALQTGVGLWAAWQLRPSLRTSPDPFDRAAKPVLPVDATDPWARDADGSPLPAQRGPSNPSPDAPAWVRGPSTLDWTIARFSRLPLRRDRSPELVAEPGGRIDRLDVLIVLVLIVLVVTLRGFRLDQPTSMYFDEVYHARTATEFLQHWEYGLPHDIYEFTHPHLAKYAMAWGIRLAGGNEVRAVDELAVPVRGAALERRWDRAGDSGERAGDRLYVGGGEELRVYDLATRDLVETFPVEATALAVDEEGHRLFIADPRGGILALDTTVFDERRGGGPQRAGLEAFSTGPGTPIEEMALASGSLVAISVGSVATFDGETGDRLAETFALGVEGVAALPAAERVVVDTTELDDPEEVAEGLAEALGDEASRITELLTQGPGNVVVEAYLAEDERSALEETLGAGGLDGVRLESGALLALTASDGIRIVDARTLDLVDEIPTEAPVRGLALVEGLSEPTIYAAAGSELVIVPVGDAGPGLPTTLRMPGEVVEVVWNEPANLVHVLGDSPEGGPTIYVVEPNANAVFIDVPLPEEPGYLLADTQPERPGDDRATLLAIGSGGDVVSVSIGQNAFGWRLPGMLLGALAAGLLYLLGRVLFTRRSVGLIAAVLVIAEGMLFANSRIAMNDVYVTTFVIAGVLLFAPLYLAPRRPWTAVGALLAAGLALGLALASKWVALYAIGGLVLLVLLRSGLGRLIALAGMVGLTALLGAMAIRPAPVEDPSRNWAFVLLMLLLTGLLAAGIVRRPLPVTRGELRLAVVGPLLLGLGLLVVGALRPGPLEEAGADALLAPARLVLAGALAFAGGAGILVVAWLAGRIGRGPLAAGARRGGAGTTSTWLLPGRLAGLPWLFTLAALALVPIAIYIVSYAPWVELGNQWGIPFVGDLPFLPPGGESGQTLPELTRSMYEYHDDLRAEHAASSPWWAWPLDLKPVWFFQERYAGDTTGLIYDTGNLVIFWLGIPALAFTAWSAWRRRSVALAIVVVMWAALWMPWARIDRATFQYHVYASLPFLILSLAYFLAELWHGPSQRVWFLARASAALAILAVPLLWLLRVPLCALAGTAVAHPEGVACATEVTRTAQVSEAGLAALLVAATGAGAAALVGWRAARAPRGDPAGRSQPRAWLVALGAVGLATLAGVLAAFVALDATSTTPLALSSDALAALALAVLAIPAWIAFRARDSRRFTLGVLAVALLWLLVWYPNISGLPLPSQVANVYQGLLPTWSWDFQFAVNTDPPAEGGVVDVITLVVAAITLVFVVAVGIGARAWGRPAPEDVRDPAYPSVRAVPPT